MRCKLVFPKVCDTALRNHIYLNMSIIMRDRQRSGEDQFEMNEMIVLGLAF